MRHSNPETGHSSGLYLSFSSGPNPSVRELIIMSSRFEKFLDLKPNFTPSYLLRFDEHQLEQEHNKQGYHKNNAVMKLHL